MNRISFSSLRARLILFVLLALVPAFGLIFYQARQERLLATAAAGEKALGLARTAATEQHRLISETRRFLGQLAQERHWGLTDPTTCSALVADQLNRHPQYLNLGVINLKGDLVCSALPLNAPINVADRTYFRRVVETKDFSIGEYQIGRVTGKATVNFGYPEFDDTGKFHAVLIAALDLTAIEQVFVKAKRDKGSVFLMLDLKGTVLSRYPDLEKRVGKPFQDPSILKAIQAKQDEIKGQAIGVDGIERLYAFTSLRSGGEIEGFIGIGIPLKVAFVESDRSLINDLFLIGLAIVFILAATWFGSDLFVLRQVNALVVATKRLGSGDLSARTGLPHDRNELGQLARSFDEMADSLHTLTRRNELILTSAGEGIYGVDLDGKTTFINPAAAKILGYEPSELIGQPMHALAHHSKLDATPYPKEECPIYAAFMDGAVHHIDDEVFWRKDGTSFWVEYVSTPVRENGKILGAVVAFKDITERRKAEEALQAHYQELLTLHETSQAILFSPDLRTTLEKVLDKAVVSGSFDLGVIRLYDHRTQTIQPIVYQGYRDLENVQRHHQRSIAATTGRYSTSVLTDRQPRIEENVAQCEGLRTFKREGVQSAVVIPVMTEKEVLGVLQLGSRTSRKFHPNEIRLAETVGNQIGIAVQKARLYEETQDNLERIRALHEIDKAISSTLDLNATLAILQKTIPKFVSSITASTVRLMDEGSGRLEPASCWNLSEDEWRAHVKTGRLTLADKVFESQKPLKILNVEKDSAHPVDFARNYGLVSYLGVPLSAKEERLGVLGLYTKEQHEFSAQEVEFLNTLAGQAAIAIHNARLFEETKKQAIELERSNKVKDEFLSVISHELRTPLNIISGYTTLLQDKTLGEVQAEQQDALKKIEAQSRELLMTVDSILDITSLEALREPRAINDVDIDALLSEVRSDCEVLTQKKVDIVWDYAPDLPVIKADSKKIKRILQNLIHNAVKFTEEGQITISAKLRDQPANSAVLEPQRSSAGERGSKNGAGEKWLEVKVIDTGVGIPSDAMSRIFDRFYQADSSATRNFGGMGLGLYIVRQFTDILGGSIEAKSALGKGSTFTVTLPVTPPASSNSAIVS